MTAMLDSFSNGCQQIPTDLIVFSGAFQSSSISVVVLTPNCPPCSCHCSPPTQHTNALHSLSAQRPAHRRCPPTGSSGAGSSVSGHQGPVVTATSAPPIFTPLGPVSVVSLNVWILSGIIHTWHPQPGICPVTPLKCPLSGSVCRKPAPFATRESPRKIGSIGKYVKISSCAAASFKWEQCNVINILADISVWSPLWLFKWFSH